MGERSSGRSARFSFDDVVGLLVPTLGREKSVDLIEAALKRLRLPRANLDLDETRRIFDSFSAEKGLVGVAARFVKTRLDHQAMRVSSVPAPERQKGVPVSLEPAAPSTSARGPSLEPEPPSSSRHNATVTPSANLVQVSEIVRRLAPSIGFEHATDVVLEACRAVGAIGEDLTPAQALAVFDNLAAKPGLLGVAARFAKAHVLLSAAKVSA